MKRTLSLAILCCLFPISASARPEAGKPANRPAEIVSPDADLGGTWFGSESAPAKVLADTIWIASWSFDASVGHCTDSGWQKIDNYIKNDGSLYWSIGPGFGGTGGIAGNAAILGYSNNACCAEPNGYDNDWYQAIRMQYAGSATLSFDYLLDSEEGFDFMQVETDSACASFARAAAVPPTGGNFLSSALFRDAVFTDSGYDASGAVAALALTDYGPGTHCVYISLSSDGGYSPCDGHQPTTLGRALVVDDIVLTGALPLNENFEGATNPGIVTINMFDTYGYGQWGRLFSHITDNDICSENTTCAWLWTDYITPTINNGGCDTCPPFGGGFVIKNWIDNSIVSPWVSLASTPSAGGTVLRFRVLGGNFFTTSRIVANWSVHAKQLVQGQECASWRRTSTWEHLNSFRWVTQTIDLTPDVGPGAIDLQLRYRVSDWQYIAGGSPPAPFIPLWGPSLDAVRIGRVLLAGPFVGEGADARSQGQDAFPTEIDPGVSPAGEHYRPTTDRFGTCAFSPGTDLGAGTSPNLITGDSITVQVRDARGAGGITSVVWYGAIVAGPHAGKAPAPYTVGANGFFAVPADSVRTAGGAVIADNWFFDLDDTYFRGGDQLNYFWLASDAGGGVTSDPPGLTAVPASPSAAQLATGGMLEASFLPTIAWAPAYLARIAADPNGDLEPTSAELAASTQKNCILYVNHMNARRRSGDVNRTSFMYTLDNLGYRTQYDVYDHTGMGNTNNHLGGRATIQQAQGYALIVYDAGNGTPGRPIMPDGVNLETEKIDQATWFRSWLAQAASPAVDFATLWLLGSNMVEEHSTNALYTSNCGVALATTNQALNLNPDVAGQSSFTFDKGSGSSTIDFRTGARAAFSLNGGCPQIRNYDGLSASGGSAVRVYRYREPVGCCGTGGTLGAGATVMNVNTAEDWNTITMSFPWFDIRYLFDNVASRTPPTIPPPARDLMAAILSGVLPVACIRTPGPTDSPEDPALGALPVRTALHANVPNPFNPTTTIRFDLARKGRVRLRIYDAAGRLVRALLDQEMQAGFGRRMVWNGLDGAGRRAPTGIYFCRLEAEGFAATHKMVLLQ